MKPVAIRVSGVSKNFRLPHERSGSIKSLVMNGIGGKKGYEVQHALKGIDLEINHGEFFGIVGRNGSGKSTLLKILAGIYQPSSGKVETNGKLVPFIELGVGFNSELTGRENVYLNGALLGFSRQKIDEIYDEIVAFSELSRFMDQKLKNYSSGMQVRLAFAVATHAEADILLVDEVLAVGDADFQRKCFKHFKQLKKDKKTVVFVSHDMNAVREYCDRAVLIEKNEIVKIGKVSEVATAYTRLFMADRPSRESANKKKRWGDEKIVFSGLELDKHTFTQDDDTIGINLTYKVNDSADRPVFGMSIKNSAGTVIAGTNTRIRHIETGVFSKGDKGTIRIEMPNILNDGEYALDVAIAHDDTITAHDWWEDAQLFTVFREEHTPFSVEPPINFDISHG